MRYSLMLLFGAVVGVVVTLQLQDIRNGLCRVPIVGQYLCSAPPVSAAAPEATAVPIILPTATPMPPSISWRDAKMVNKVVYAEKEYSARFDARWDHLVISGRVILSKVVTALSTGSCAAGIDYEARRPTEQVTGTRVMVRIPEPELLGCSVDSLVYVEGNGLLPAPPEVYNQLAEQAITETRKRAQEGDLLARARESAVTQTELYLRRLGFREVLIEVGDRR